MPRSWRLLVCALLVFAGLCRYYNLNNINIFQFHRSLSYQLSQRFPYDIQSDFPSYIWQTWKYARGSDRFEEYDSASRTWDLRNPASDHRILTDIDAEDFLKDVYKAFPDILEAYNSLPKPVLKADFFRYLILLAKGGVYTDIDTGALKPVSDWVAQEYRKSEIGLVVGIEADPDREDWSNWYSRRIQICQWTILSKPGHPVLVDIVNKITLETLHLKAENKLNGTDLNVIELTGPAIWTDTVFAHFNRVDECGANRKIKAANVTFTKFTGIRSPRLQDDVLVLPITSFSPGVGHMGSEDYSDPMAFVRHEFAGSWKDEGKYGI